MKAIDLNCDMGESFGAYQIGMDESVIAYISSANIACGWHAGDPMVMDRTIRMAKEHGVSPGAHPGYPDLMGFGRREMNLRRDEIRNYMIYQIGALQGFCAAHDLKLHHVKPHGSLYLSGLAVVEQHRNAGIGLALMEAVNQRAKDLSLPRISLIVFERNEGALRLYRRLGYRELDRRTVVRHSTLRYRDGDVLLLARET